MSTSASKSALLILGMFIATATGVARAAESGSRPTTAASPVQTYGELFFIEHLEKKSPSLFVEVGPGLVFSNPYYETFFVNASAQVHLSRYFRLGPSAYLFKSSPMPVTRLIEGQLQGVAFRQLVDERLYSVFASLSMIPFSGHLAFFGLKAIPLTLTGDLGMGGAWYRTAGFQPELQWKVGLGTSIGPHFNTTLQFGQWIGLTASSNIDTFGMASMGVGL